MSHTRHIHTWTSFNYFYTAINVAYMKVFNFEQHCFQGIRKTFTLKYFFKKKKKKAPQSQRGKTLQG